MIDRVGPCDVTSKDDLEKLYKEISSKEKHIDLLSMFASVTHKSTYMLIAPSAVANAGISGNKAEPSEENATELKDKLWKSEEFADWSDTFNTNVSAVYFTTVAFLPLLQAGTEKRGHLSASVIVISSMSGIMRNSQGHFAYNAAKGATVHLSKLMSAEFQKTRVRVNSIAPGYFPSEMSVKDSDDANKSHMPQEKISEKGHVPADRAGSDEEMAQAVVFLTKNKYVNGEIIAVDGGVLNELPGR